MDECPRLAAAGARNHERRTITRRDGRILLSVEGPGIIQRELRDDVLIRSPFQKVGLNISFHDGIRLRSEAHDRSGRAV